jgi:hypothetical protein
MVLVLASQPNAASRSGSWLHGVDATHWASDRRDNVAKPRRAATGWILVAVTAAGLTPRGAFGCTCTDWPTFDRAFSVSAAVFRGTVTSIGSAGDPYFEQVWVLFQTDAWWKGAASERVAILTAENEGICGYPFVVGVEYLVFATERYHGSGPPFGTGLRWATHQTWSEIQLSICSGRRTPSPFCRSTGVV